MLGVTRKAAVSLANQWVYDLVEADPNPDINEENLALLFSIGTLYAWIDGYYQKGPYGIF
jgi:hypothetical protein